MSWLGLASAGIQAGGSLLGGALGAAGQSASNAQQFQNQEMLFNQQQAETWALYNDQKQQQNTAWQRGMADMKAAGLNPILAATMGPEGTASPSMAGTPSAPPVGNVGGMMGAGVSSAAQAGQVYANVKATTAQANKDDTASDVNKATEDLTKKQSDKVVADTETSKSAARLNDAAALTKVSEAASNAANANSANALARVNTRVAEDTERFGDSPISKAVGGILRMLHTGLSQLPNSAKAANAVGVTDPNKPAPPVYRRGPDGRPITDFWGRPK